MTHIVAVTHIVAQCGNTDEQPVQCATVAQESRFIVVYMITSEHDGSVMLADMAATRAAR